MSADGVAVAGDGDTVIGKDVDDGVGVVVGGGAFHDGFEGVVMDVLDHVVVSLVVMALEDSQDLAGVFEEFTDGWSVFDIHGAGAIEELVGKDDGGAGGGCKVVAEPVQLSRGEVGVAPVEIAAVIRGTLAGEVCVQDDEVEVMMIERVVGAFGVDAGVLGQAQKLPL